jgi:Beta-lactamase
MQTETAFPHSRTRWFRNMSLFGVPVPFDYYNTSAVPAGFLVSSAEDMTHYLVAQMNGGRFGRATVLSPTGIATMHAPGVAITEGSDTGSSYGMGWNNGILAGIPAIWHDGAEPNVSTRLLIEPQTHWGAVLLFNANSFIPVDGANSALTSLEAGVTRMLAGQAPLASLSLTTLYLIIDGVLVVLSVLAIFPLLRLRRWARRFEQRQRQRPQFIRLGLRLTWDVALPVALLLLLLFFVNNFNGATFYDVWLTYPDLDSWLLVISALLLLTAASRAVLAIRVLRRKGAETPAVTPSPSPSLT